jgi:predicted RNase H-like HicB family nuclease
MYTRVARVRILVCKTTRPEMVIMRNEFKAIIKKDGEWFVGHCPGIPGANGQGKTVAECRESLAQAIALILEDSREDGLKTIPIDAIRDTVVVR